MEMLKGEGTSGWVMNESMDPRVHIWICGWMNGGNESTEKGVKVASYSSFKPLSNSNIFE